MTMEETVELLKNQIKTKKAGMLTYTLKERVYCPHLLGRCRDGRIVLQAYQVPVNGEPERQEGWRFFYLDGVTDAKDYDGVLPWHPQNLEKAEKTYQPPKFVVEVLALVELS